MTAHHDDFAVEPVPGLPARPPMGEEVLWQGRPSTLALARDAYKITWIGVYFVALAVWRATVLSDGTLGTIVAVMLPYVTIGAVAVALLLVMAAIQARSTVYTITSSRVALRIGAALTVTLNVPYKQVGNATLAVNRNGTGTIALETLGDTRISYLVCWPHVRPWHLARTQPALRSIPDAARVAKLLADAAQTRLNQPEITRTVPQGMAVAAE
jgi:hypothetical protein